MRLSLNIKKTIIAVFDVLLAVYLLLAVTSFNSPKAETTVCNKVDINISDANNAGFLSAGEIKNILVKHKLYPYGKQLSSVDPRRIEDVLKVSPFVNTAECYKAKNGNVCITITQRMPIVRIKSITGDDYYL
ncbi:MAG: cell division protein FtsQ, partial [Prevotella sp.]|nr:cell division protein FtsQ [Prevotella sp.]